MHFDLELILVLGSLVTGVVWLLDKYWLRAKRQETIIEGITDSPVTDTNTVTADSHKVAAGTKVTIKQGKEPWYVEYSRSFFPVLAIVLVLRTFIAEPFHIPSGSMRPNLLIGDFILVNKFAYGLRLPVLHNKILSLGDPERGDAIVFRYPPDPRKDYIKRLIGLPGDTILYTNKQLYINGEKLAMQQIGPYESKSSDEQDYIAYEWKENLLGLEHKVLIDPGNLNLMAEGKFLVPEGHYFTMGDNRDNSADSRYWGFVPEENLVGKALFIWMNWNFSAGSADFGRIGTVIH